MHDYFHTDSIPYQSGLENVCAVDNGQCFYGNVKKLVVVMASGVAHLYHPGHNKLVAGKITDFVADKAWLVLQYNSNGIDSGGSTMFSNGKTHIPDNIFVLDPLHRPWALE